MRQFIYTVRTACAALLVFTCLAGVAYPLLVLAMAQVAFPYQANGSIRIQQNHSVGSDLIGQPFDQPRYLWGRPSATLPTPYTAFDPTSLAGSTGSNAGPLSPALADLVRARIAALRAADPQASLPIPVDLITASASGLDPEISPAAASYQVRRIARVRGLSEAQVAALVAQATHGRDWGIFGEPRVNVLELNLALDAFQNTHP